MDITIDSLREGDMFKTESGITGIKLYGEIYSTADHIEFTDDIVEIKKELFNKIIDKKVDFEKLWDSIQEDSVFLVIDYEASPEDSKAVENLLKSEDIRIIKYDLFISEEYNYKKLREATRHIIIPSSDFLSTHIIGAGLLFQIRERQKVGKSSEIYVEGKIFPIKEVCELKEKARSKAAVVIY